MTKQKIASILLYIVSLGIVGFGVIYIYKGYTVGLMPYHFQFLGVESCDQLDPKVSELMKTFVHIIGFAFTAIGVTFFLLVKGMFNGEQDDYDWKIIAAMILVLVPIIYEMINLASYTPWKIVTGLLVIAAIALFLSRSRTH